MGGKIYISNGVINLSEYISSIDDLDCYNCWNDEETQNGYNYRFAKSFEEWSADTANSPRFEATITRVSDNKRVGTIFLSSGELPDLAFMIYRPYRKQGYGTAAFALGAKYCLENLGINKIYAGCYLDNIASVKILENCGFIPHPEGNIYEKHYLTGEDRVQHDFIKYSKSP